MVSLCRESLQLLRYPLTAAILRDITKGIPMLSDLYKTRNSKCQFFISLNTAFLTFIFCLISDVFFNEDLCTYQAMNKNAQPNSGGQVHNAIQEKHITQMYVPCTIVSKLWPPED
jgi:hypothetical protein